MPKFHPHAECQYCGGTMYLETMRCEDCETAVEGVFELSPLSELDPEDQQFVRDFVMVSGSLKSMAEKLDVSYPTVRRQLDEIITTLKG